MQPIAEIEAVHEMIGRYVAGTRSGDVDVLASAFHADATMYGFLNGDATNVPIGAFFDMVKSFDAPEKTGAPYRARITSVEVNETAATATLVEENYLGFTFVNYFTLLRCGGDWRIVSKTYQQLPSAP